MSLTLPKSNLDAEIYRYLQRSGYVAAAAAMAAAQPKVVEDAARLQHAPLLLVAVESSEETAVTMESSNHIETLTQQLLSTVKSFAHQSDVHVARRKAQDLHATIGTLLADVAAVAGTERLLEERRWQLSANRGYSADDLAGLHELLSTVAVTAKNKYSFAGAAWETQRAAEMSVSVGSSDYPLVAQAITCRSTDQLSSSAPATALSYIRVSMGQADETHVHVDIAALAKVWRGARGALSRPVSLKGFIMLIVALFFDDKFGDFDDWSDLEDRILAAESDFHHHQHDQAHAHDRCNFCESMIDEIIRKQDWRSKRPRDAAEACSTVRWIARPAIDT